MTPLAWTGQPDASRAAAVAAAAAERYSAIERENRILLEKMSHILHGKHGLDNKRKSKPRSMNRLVRRAELVRITNENQRILRKIQSSEPTYNHLTWEQERRAHEKYLRSLSEYDEFGREKALVKAVGRRAAGAMAGAGRPTSGRRRGRPASAPVRRVSGGADADAYGGAGAAAYGDGYGGPADASYGYDGDAGAGGGAGGRVEYRRGGGGRGGRARPQSAGPSHHSYAGRTDSLPTEDDAELGVIRDD